MRFYFTSNNRHVVVFLKSLSNKTQKAEIKKLGDERITTKEVKRWSSTAVQSETDDKTSQEMEINSGTM